MWNAFKMLLLYIVIQTVLIFGISIVYVGLGKDPALLGNYMTNIQIYLVLTLAVIFIPLLVRQYKKLNIKSTKTRNLHLYILFTIFLSIGYNTLAYYLDKYILLSNLYGNNANIIVGIISTVLIGPIIEELMFRGIMYNNLKYKFDIKKSTIITTIVFCFSHFTLIQIVYTFIFGLMLIKLFERYQNIKYPIIIHMVSNLTTTLISLFIIKDYLVINITILLVSIIILYLVYRKIKKCDIID